MESSQTPMRNNVLMLSESFLLLLVPDAFIHRSKTIWSKGTRKDQWRENETRTNANTPICSRKGAKRTENKRQEPSTEIHSYACTNVSAVLFFNLIFDRHTNGQNSVSSEESENKKTKIIIRGNREERRNQIELSSGVCLESKEDTFFR
jgi:hypothetical protein